MTVFFWIFLIILLILLIFLAVWGQPRKIDSDPPTTSTDTSSSTTSSATSSTTSSPSSSNWQGLAIAAVVLAAIAGGLLWWSPWKKNANNFSSMRETLNWTQGDVPGVIRLVTPRNIKAGDSILLLNTRWAELYKGSKKIKTCSKKAGCQKIKFLSVKAGTFSFRPKEKKLPPMIKVVKILRH